MMCVGKHQETRDKLQNKQFDWTGLNLWWYDDTVVFTMCEEPVLVVELWSGLHKLWYPGIRDRSTWGKFGAHGEHGDVFLFSNLGAL